MTMIEIMDMLEVIRVSEPTSATAIAKEMKLSKATPKLKDDISELKLAGLITPNNSSRYTSYSLSDDGKIGLVIMTVMINLVDASALSATAIAKLSGYSKAAKISSALNILVDVGCMISDDSGRFTTYKLACQNPEIKSHKEVIETVDVSVSDDLEERADTGYTVVDTNDNGVPVKKVTTPNGTIIKLKDGESLMVVNDEPKYAVKSSADALGAIERYTKAAQWATFIVEDIFTKKKIKSPDDLDLNCDILFISIKPHNKAGK